MLQAEGRNLFDSRSAALGHTLQGGIPSPMDRARAVRLSLKCMAFLESHHEAIRSQSPSTPPSDYSSHTRKAKPDSAAVITIRGSKVEMTPVKQLVEYADMDNRRGINTWWEGLKELAEALGGKTELMREWHDGVVHL